MAAALSITPFGGPVVPLVYRIRAGASGSGAGRSRSARATRPRVGRSEPGTTSMPTRVAPDGAGRGQERRGRRESREDVGAFEGAGVGRHGHTGTPAARPPSTATTVSRVAVASTATAGRPLDAGGHGRRGCGQGREVEGRGRRPSRRPDGR